MKKRCLLLFTVLISFTAFAQNVGIGTESKKDVLAILWSLKGMIISQ